jgi:hypothetical protein
MSRPSISGSSSSSVASLLSNDLRRDSGARASLPLPPPPPLPLSSEVILEEAEESGEHEEQSAADSSSGIVNGNHRVPSAELELAEFRVGRSSSDVSFRGESDEKRE